VGGIIHKSKMIKIKDAEQDDKQEDFFK